MLDTPTLVSSYIPEPLLEFADGRHHVDPKTGIIRFGPKSLRPGDRHPARVRTGFIGTPETIQKAGAWIDRTSKGVKGAPERLEFPGFRRDRGFFAEVELSDDWNAPLFNSELAAIKGHRKRIDRFTTAVSLIDSKLAILSRKDRPPEYVILALPDELLVECQTVDHTTAEEGKVHRNFRRVLKAIAMKYRLPTQILLEKTTGDNEPADYPSDIAWDFFTALYFKAGGFPWGPVGLTPGSCFVGIGFFRPLGSGDSRVQSSLVQAFDEHGDGLVLRGQDFQWDAMTEGSRSPHLTEEQAAWMVDRTLDRYKEEMGQAPTRMVIHKSSRYWEAEAKGFRSALETRGLQYDLVALASTDTVRLFPVNQYPPLRGTRFTLNDLDYLYTTGFQADLQQFHANHVPSALQLADHIGGDTSRAQLLQEIMVLSKMNWNCSLMGGLLPITLTFARRVGDILRECGEVEPLANFKYYI
ncbi:MAG: hypothetical protein AB7G17_07375 [Phycisphaerales bacterium]